MSDLMTTPDAAKKLGISDTQFRKLAEKRGLTSRGHLHKPVLSIKAAVQFVVA